MAEFSNFDLRMFAKAKEIASTSNFSHFRMGCVITYKRHILSCAPNNTKTHPMQKHYNKYRNFRKDSLKPCVHSVHAEIAALSLIPSHLLNEINWRDVSIYVYRIAPGKSGQFGLASPCPACRQALIDKGVRNFYYTGNGSYIYEKVVK